MMRQPRIDGILILILAVCPSFISCGHDSSKPALASSGSSPSAKDIQNRSVNSEPADSRRKLRVVLYPIIPAFTDYMFQIKTGFENSSEGKDVQIEFEDLTSGYYDPTKKTFVESAQADVYEIDSVFLSDFVSTAKIQEVPGQLRPKPEDYLANAEHAAQLDGKFYGVPHWVCGNLLFFQKDDAQLASVRTLNDLKKTIGTTRKPESGLFIDLKGKSTLGEFYLMSLFDRYQSASQVQSHLMPYDANVEKRLEEVGTLCDVGFCRSQNYHEAVGFYESQFARRHARAMVGYSEALYYVLWEAENACAEKEKCYSDGDLNVSELPLDDHGSTQMSWVDLLTIDTGCKAQCLTDAAAFVKYITSDATQLQALTGYPPRYLLPASATLYANPLLQKAAPLYNQIRPIIEKAETPTAPKLEQTLRTYGETLDKDLPVPK